MEMKSITKYLSTKVNKVNKINDFYDVISILNNIANKDNQLIDIVNSIREYYEESESAKIMLDYLADLVKKGYEPTLQTDYKTYFRLNNQPIEFNENSKMITFSFYYPESNHISKNIAMDIYDFEKLTWELVILAMNENSCVLYELNGDSFKQLKNFIEEGSLESDLITKGYLNDATVNGVCNYLSEKLFQ